MGRDGGWEGYLGIRAEASREGRELLGMVAGVQLSQ